MHLQWYLELLSANWGGDSPWEQLFEAVMISTRYFQVLCNIGKGLSKSVKLVFLSDKLDLRDIKRSD